MISLKSVESVSKVNSEFKRRKVEADIEKSEYSVHTQNKFEVLSDMEEEEEQGEPQKLNKVPPIVIYSVIENHTDDIRKFKDSLKGELEIKYKYNRIIFKPSNMEDYKTIINNLDAVKAEYHTYTPQEERPLKVVLKNIPPNVTEEEVKVDLIQKNIKVLRVSQMTKTDEGEQIKLPMFLITLHNQTQFRELLKIRAVCYCSVAWERYKTRNVGLQCYKCQSFGHAAANCHRTTRCAKCSLNHDSRECKTVESKKYKCSNCGGPHMSSDKTCPIYNNYLQNKMTLRQKIITSKHRNFNLEEKMFPQLATTNHRSSEVQTSVKWSQVAGGSGQAKIKQGETENTSLGSIFSEIKSLFNFQKLKSTLIGLVGKIKKEKDPLSKVMAIFECLFEFLD